ncbi:MAG: elongation factor 1-beta [Candidatus Pacearchaeota archaeon]
MAKVIVTVKIMPEDPDVNLDEVTKKSEEIIKGWGGSMNRTEIEPVGFGLKALILVFAVDEKKGSADPIADDIVKKVPGVRSAEVIMASRALG